MGKPRMIILIRHAQSEGNKNREIHQTVPDHRVKLTAEGQKQALEAGRKLRGLLRPDDTIHFFTSPYRRTRETTEGILNSLTTDDPSPSPFPRHTIKVYEEPRLREQDFGNFQPCSAEMERMWQERADYGHFFYRIPNGESAADAYDRVSGFNESLWRQFGDEDFASVCVLVTHGLMTRVFLMKWYHFSVEYFEDLRNINHCEFVIMEKNDNGKYILRTKLRTWTELKRERELEKKRERAEKGLPEPGAPTTGMTTSLSDASVPVKRKWGGCPDGCNHGLPMRSRTGRRLMRKDTSGTFRDGNEAGSSATEFHKDDMPLASALYHHRHDRLLPTESSQVGGKLDTVGANGISPEQNNPQISIASLVDPSGAMEDKRYDHIPSSSDTQGGRRQDGRYEKLGLTSDDDSGADKLNVDTFLHLGGRDGGGSTSGVNSLAPSDEEETDNQKSILADSDCTLRQISATSSNETQDVEEDGDDEGKGVKPPTRRPKLHSHNYFHRPGISPIRSNSASKSSQSLEQLPSPRMANVLGDGDVEEADESFAEMSDNGLPPLPPAILTSTAMRERQDSLDEDCEQDQA